MAYLNRYSLALIATLLLAACGDFLNSPRQEVAETQVAPGQRQKNPFGPGYENPNSGPFTEEKMLVNTGVNVLAKSTRAFAIQAALLQDEIETYCDAIGDGADESRALTSAQDQWKKAMRAYHEVDAVPVGPLMDSGRFLSDHLYSWPLLDPCAVDRETVRLQETGVPNPRLIYRAKGLGALEYLLFENSLVSTCNPRAYPQTAAWSAKSAAEKKADRCELAKYLAQDVSQKADDLKYAWDPDGGNFSKTLIDGSRFQPLKEATNALTDALFALELMKDQRVGRPIGQHPTCQGEKCPEDAEHVYSGYALEAIAARLRGFRAGFFGHRNPQAQAFGLDDFLKSAGHPEVAETMRLNLQRAIESADTLALQGSLQEQIAKIDPAACAATTVTDRREPVCALFQDIRTLTTAMKIEVLSILSLRSPPIFEGDND